jgi:hypothetical protein
MHRHAVEYSTYPRGPRSGPGCSVPVRHHLIGPIRPTRGHIAISPHSGLYAMPSLCGSAYREVQKSTFARFLMSFNFRLLQQYRRKAAVHGHVSWRRTCRDGGQMSPSGPGIDVELCVHALICLKTVVSATVLAVVSIKVRGSRHDPASPNCMVWVWQARGCPQCGCRVRP